MSAEPTLFNSIRQAVKRYNLKHRTNYAVTAVGNQMHIVEVDADAAKAAAAERPTKLEFVAYLMNMQPGSQFDIEQIDRWHLFKEWAGEAAKQSGKLLTAVENETLTKLVIRCEDASKVILK